MAVDEYDDMDDEEDIPLPRMSKMKMEPMNIDDMPPKRRMIVKKEKLVGRSLGLSAKAKSIPGAIENDSD